MSAPQVPEVTAYPADLAAAEPPPPPANTADKDEKRSAAAVLVDLAESTYVFGVTPDGEPYAVQGRGEDVGHVARMLRGGGGSLRAELASAYRKKTGRVAGQQALADALLVLEGEALDAEPVQAHLRVAEHGGAVYLDLGDPGEAVLRITAGVWEIVREPVPVRFRRTKLTGALPVPVRGGSLEPLWRCVNVAADDRPLVLAWLVSAIIAPTIPHPALAVFAEQGAGKSTTSRVLVSLVDPSPVPLRKPPRDADGWVTAAAGSWVVGLDNLSTVPEWFSDSLCRAVTGDGDVRRALYTDGGLAVFAFRRVILLNGIDVGAMRGDLAERLLVVNLARLSEGERVREHDLDELIETHRATIYGALLDLAAGVKAVLPSVRLDSSPRMADFAAILAGVDRVQGTSGLARYTEQARTIAEETLESDPFLVALGSAKVTFTGTAAELLAELTPAEDGWRAPKGWPANARAVTTTLKRNAPALRKAGWTVDNKGAANKEGLTEWAITHPEKARKSSPPPPLSPPTAPDGGETGTAGNGYGQSQDDTPLPFTPHRGSCASCGGPMRVIEPGQRVHPGCIEAAA